MSDLINRDHVIEALTSNPISREIAERYNLVEFIKSMPVEAINRDIIFCKDCDQYVPIKDTSYHECLLSHGYGIVRSIRENDYCSRAQRKKRKRY